MHRRKILGTLIVTAACLFGAAPSLAAKAPKVDVFAEFQKRISKLEGELKKEKDIAKRYEAFLKSYAELAELRAKNPRQAEEKEINMSLFMDTLVSLPAKAEFKAAKCKDYQREVNDLMKSYAKDQKEPFVEKASQVLELICK